MTRIGLLSDTHGYLSPKIFTHFKEVDEIWHAGDIGTTDLVDELENFKPLRAVYGNIDGADMRVRYPENLFFVLDGVKVLMMHIGGYPPNYNVNSKPLIAQYQPDLFICGHSHILKAMPDSKNNLLHLNPGACGVHGWHQIATIMRFALHEGRVKNLEVIELGKRGKLMDV